jgi:hypothetical protein
MFLIQKVISLFKKNSAVLMFYGNRLLENLKIKTNDGLIQLESVQIAKIKI